MHQQRKPYCDHECNKNHHGITRKEPRQPAVRRGPAHGGCACAATVGPDLMTDREVTVEPSAGMTPLKEAEGRQVGTTVPQYSVAASATLHSRRLRLACAGMFYYSNKQVALRISSRRRPLRLSQLATCSILIPCMSQQHFRHDDFSVHLPRDRRVPLARPRRRRGCFTSTRRHRHWPQSRNPVERLGPRTTPDTAGQLSTLSLRWRKR